MELLDRDSFREQVFKRDNYKCVICLQPGQDAHHIIERRLWGDSGYYLDNGATLCGQHHIEAEQTVLACDVIREASKIERVILPSHLYSDNNYDKWGNIILTGDRRVRGELFYDESVQKILKQGDMLHHFVSYVKYPRTYHLPWSPGFTKDDRVLSSVNCFSGKRVVVTEKMDGENTSMYPDYIHARSIDSRGHNSQSWVKRVQSEIGFNIPDGFRICGENMYAKHTIHYRNLIDYFQLFSIWGKQNECLSWDDTLEWAELLGLKTVPVLYDGIWNEGLIRSLYKPERDGNESEGYVVRLAESFPYGSFRESIAKYVRAGHVPVHGGHWRNRVVVPNEVRV